jgi:2-polyprenyl-3-methyl-5-hydroxy-6-metoxy-1,4-benzoquinol methylase
MAINANRFAAQQERMNLVAEFVGEGYNVLELGTGDGSITHHLIKYNKVTTADATSPADYKFDFNNFPYPFASKSFDVIVLAEVLEHLLRPDKVLLECKRVLKDDGRLVLTMPNIASIKNLISILFLGKVTYAAEPNATSHYGHVCDYWPNRAKEVIEGAGFKIKRYETTCSYLVWCTLPKWLYPKRLGEFIVLECAKDVSNTKATTVSFKKVYK